MDIVKGLEQKANKRQGDWIEPTLLNGWINFGAPFAGCSYFKDNFGIIHLRGVVKSGVIGQAFYNLPVGYRPSANIDVASCSNNAFCVITIEANGNIFPLSGNNQWVSLAGITFREA